MHHLTVASKTLWDLSLLPGTTVFSKIQQVPGPSFYPGDTSLAPPPPRPGSKHPAGLRPSEL